MKSCWKDFYNQIYFSFYKKEVQNKDEQNKEMNKIKDELIQLQQSVFFL